MKIQPQTPSLCGVRAAASATPVDQFTSSTPPPTADLRSVFDFRGLDKKSHRYELRGFDFSPDGSVCSAYQDPASLDGNYVSVRGADGAVLWERRVVTGDGPAGQNGIRAIQRASDGSLRVLAGDRLMAFEADGQERFSVEAEGATDLQRTTDGSSFFMGRPFGTLRAVAADGTPRALPRATAELGLAALRPGPDGLLGRRENEIWRIDTESGQATLLYAEPRHPAHNTTATVRDMEATRDGGLAMRVDEVTVTESYIPSGGHMSFGPMMLMMSPMGDPDQWRPTPQRVERYTLRTPEGVVWKTPTLDPKCACVESSKSVLVTRLEGGRTKVERLTPDGRQDVATLSGPPVGVTAGPRGAIVHHAGTVTRLSDQRAVSPGIDYAMFETRGFTPDGRLVIANRERVGIVDFEAGKVIPLTDHEQDASWKVAPPPCEPRKTAGTIQVEPEYVDVGGIRVPRKQP